VAGVEFRVLGDVGVVIDGEERRLRPMERTLLAVMLADYNRLVATDQLMERVWRRAHALPNTRGCFGAVGDSVCTRIDRYLPQTGRVSGYCGCKPRRTGETNLPRCGRPSANGQR
jgi:hypothetical protein